MIIHAENISWTRFYNFLMFNTILILAWATIYAPQTRPGMARFVLAIMCVLGGISGVAWAGLGCRGRKFLDEYINLAVKFEADSKCWSPDVDQYKMQTLTKVWIRSFPYGKCGSRYLLTFGALAFTVFYAFLFYVSVK
jgi:hypothetical protein